MTRSDKTLDIAKFADIPITEILNQIEQLNGKTSTITPSSRTTAVTTRASCSQEKTEAEAEAEKQAKQANDTN